MGRELPAEELRVYFPPLPPNRSLMELVNWKRVDFLQLVGTTLVFAIADRYAAARSFAYSYYVRIRPDWALLGTVPQLPIMLGSLLEAVGSSASPGPASDAQQLASAPRDNNYATDAFFGMPARLKRTCLGPARE
mmetsp:Transcript_70675/g.193863  ORF Transcript_70675/g.193863 Transcript_70675/m.193863 type:complete len:135 (-) Transcript_70675:505-909(-)